MEDFSRTRFPPGGWQFHQPETNWQNPRPLSSTFDQTVQAIAKMRADNPAAKLSRDVTQIGNELELYNRRRCGMVSVSQDYIPSILKQTPWECGVYDFSRSNMPLLHGTDYFNSTIIERPDADYLLVRRATWVPEWNYGSNDIVAFRLLDNVPILGKQLQFPPQANREQFEDPRAIIMDGKAWVSCCNFVWSLQTNPHQVLIRVNDDWIGEQRYDVIHGKNRGNVFTNVGWEKNWLWFWHDGRPHFIYMTYPHEVVKCSPEFQVEKVWITNKIGSWPYGQPRGGSPPVRVGDEYVSFFHSAIDAHSWGCRRYFMGAYTFQAKPPFEITRITQNPLLTGSSMDRWAHPKPMVVFPGGAILRDQKWLVTFGVNDLDCAHITIPHEDLEKRLTKL
jgi:predicted GH43/DUF377 family glycosyl hydrolase